MKKRYVMGMILLVLMATTACAYAAEATINDEYKFTLPDNYTVIEQVENGVNLGIDDDHVISVMVYEGNKITDSMIESVISSLESQGYKVTDHQTFQYNGKDIVEIDYENQYGQFNVYTWQVDDGNYAVASYGHTSDEPAAKWDDSPVKTIYDTITNT